MNYETSDGALSDRVLAQIASTTYSDISLEDVLAHPRFALSRNAYMRVVTNYGRADPIMRQLLHEMGRTVLFNVILGHHARHEADPGHPILTVGTLRDIYLPFGLASPRTFDQTLARMRAIGLVQQVASEGDKRRKVVLPTDKMIREDLVWLAEQMTPLAVLYPERDDYAPAMAHDIRYQRAQRIISTYHYATTHQILKIEDPVLRLLQRQDAMLILFIYMLKAAESGKPNQVSLPYEQVASQIFTSRTHVRNLLNDLEAVGMTELRGRGGGDVVLTPALWSMVNRFLGLSMWGHDRVWAQACNLVETGALNFTQ